MNTIDKDLLSIQEARILAENAREAQRKLASFPQEKLDEIVECMIREIEKHARELAKMSSDETDYGKWQDKYIKNRLVCEYLGKRLKGMRCVGIIDENPVEKTMDIGVPIGVIAAICPATSPVSTTIYKSIIAIKSGNAIVFAPHPRAHQSTAKALDILITAAEEAGLPEGALSYMDVLSQRGTIELMNHTATALIINTAVTQLLPETIRSGKPVIFGGYGNGPAFIERTADISQAVRDIIASKTFDNGIVSAAEQSVVVDRCIAQEVKREFIKNDSYFMTKEEEQKLAAVIFKNDKSQEPETIGRTAKDLAKIAGFTVSESTSVLIAEQRFVSEDNPFSKEVLCPVLAYYIEDDWMQACEKCIELLIGEKNGQTLVIHSKDEAVIRLFALKKPVARVLVNTPGALGGIGITTNLFPAMTLGSGHIGVGITTDNVSPKNLIYIRHVGYGIRNLSDVERQMLTEPISESHNKSEQLGNGSIDINTIHQLLKKIAEGL